MKKIFCFIETINTFGYIVTALCEDGNVLAGHASSNEYYAKHDIGINSTWKHEKYKEHCPDGYELVWLDKPMESEEFKAAVENNKALAANETTQP